MDIQMPRMDGLEATKLMRQYESDRETRTPIIAVTAAMDRGSCMKVDMDEYIEEMRRWSAAQGEVIGVEFAEGFRQHLGHPYPQDDRIGELLRGVRKES